MMMMTLMKEQEDGMWYSTSVWKVPVGTVADSVLDFFPPTTTGV